MEDAVEMALEVQDSNSDSVESVRGAVLLRLLFLF